MNDGSADDRVVTLQYTLTTIIRERIGMNERYASQLAEDILRGLQERYGGDEVYVPKMLGRATRDAAVLAAFNGSNRDDVCRRFGIGRRTFYDILARSREN